MDQNTRNTGVINWLALLVVTGLSLALARYAESAAGWVGSAFLAVGFLVAAVSYFQMRLEEGERFESMEYEELKKAKGDSTLFTEAGEDTFTARRSRQQFERFLVPGFALLLLVLQGLAAWWCWRWLAQAAPPITERATITMALYSLFALALFMLGKYSAGLARIRRQRLVRPAAGYLMLGSVVCFAVAVSEAAAWFGVEQVDLYLARAFCALLALVAFENLVSLVFEIYRPRVKGQEARLVYESRLIGLLGQPGGLITTAAQALDYQFGFKVSETWFYKFLEKALAWLVLLQLGALWLSTFVVIIEPSEEGLLERFGQPVAGREVLGPGLHIKWPWPVDDVLRFPTGQIQSFVLGVVPDEDLEAEDIVLWTRPHYREEFNMLVASRDSVARRDTEGAEKPVPANLLVVSIPVYYRVTNLVAWAYGPADPDALLQDIADREVVRYLVGVDFDEIMSRGRRQAGEALQQRIQTQADTLGLGAQIVFVGLQGIHPPIGTKEVQVAASFEDVVGSMQRMQTNILAAQAYHAQRVPATQAEATNLVAQAHSAAVREVATAAGEADRFAFQMEAYRASPAVYRQRVYLERLSESIASVRKYLLMATNTEEVVVLNLEEKIRSDLSGGIILPPDAGNPASEAK